MVETFTAMNTEPTFTDKMDFHGNHRKESSHLISVKFLRNLDKTFNALKTAAKYAGMKYHSQAWYY